MSTTQPPALLTDLYQLTMAVGYLKRGIAHKRICCEAFVRRLPRHRSFLLVAGLERVLQFLLDFRFSDAQLDYLESVPALSGALDRDTRRALGELRFTGDVWAMPEGSLAFASEPLIRVEAELWQAQLVETALLSIVNQATLVASKAARIVVAAGEAGVMEFGSRRTHDAAAVDAARAAYIAGCVGSSNVEAGFRYGVPVFGTAAHLWTMVHPSEAEAFDAYLDVYRGGTTLLVDTYDVIEGTRRACEAARRRGDPKALGGVRVDCCLYDQDDRPTGICARVRELLDAEGFGHTRIVASGDLNERRIAALLGAGEPINAFGVGTELVCSKDAPSLGGVYKVTEVMDDPGGPRPVMKLSEGKITYPGRHQVFREVGRDGHLERDWLALHDQSPGGAPVLRPVMRGGELVGETETLEIIRKRAKEQIALLPGDVALRDRDAIAPTPTPALKKLVEQTRRRITGPQK